MIRIKSQGRFIFVQRLVEHIVTVMKRGQMEVGHHVLWRLFYCRHVVLNRRVIVALQFIDVGDSQRCFRIPGVEAQDTFVYLSGSSKPLQFFIGIGKVN